MEWERERERDSFGILYTGYILSIVNIKREIERGKREREWKEREREKEQQIINKIEIHTHLFVRKGKQAN